MKKYIIIFALIFSAFTAQAQSNKEEVDFLQAAFGMDKKEAMASYINLTDAQKAPFWKLYDAYETERKELGRERIELLKQYAKEYKTMNGEQADAWSKKVFALQKKTDKLIETYYKKVLKISDGIVATQFYQFETYVLLQIRNQILDEIPFVVKK